MAIISIQGTWSPDGGCRGPCGSPEPASNLPQGQAGDKEGAGRAEEQPDARHLPAPVRVPEAWPATACPAGRGSSGVRRLGLPSLLALLRAGHKVKFPTDSRPELRPQLSSNLKAKIELGFGPASGPWKMGTGPKY